MLRLLIKKTHVNETLIRNSLLLLWGLEFEASPQSASLEKEQNATRHFGFWSGTPWNCRCVADLTRVHVCVILIACVKVCARVSLVHLCFIIFFFSTTRRRTTTKTTVFGDGDIVSRVKERRCVCASFFLWFQKCFKKATWLCYFFFVSLFFSDIYGDGVCVYICCLCINLKVCLLFRVVSVSF